MVFLLKGDKAKKVVERTAKQTIETTFHFIKILFVILVIYISVVTLLGYIATGIDFLTNIATLSVGGFWGFFFGYFGWKLAIILEDYVKNIKNKIE